MLNTIASERTRLGLSQEEFAARIGKSRGTIVRWESNVAALDGETLCNLAEIFGCSIDYLLGRSEYRVPVNVRLTVDAGTSDSVIAVNKVPCNWNQSQKAVT